MRAKLVLIGFAASLAGACGGDSPTEVKPKTDTTVVVTSTTNLALVTPLLAEINSSATAVSQSMSATAAVTGGSIGAGGASSSLSANLAGALADDDAKQCTFDSTAVRFNCPSQTQPNGLVRAMYFQILDSAGKPQSRYDTITTAGLRRVTDLTGTTSQPLITMTGPIPATQTTKNHDDLVLSGIRTKVHRQNGSGTMDQTIAAEGRPTSNSLATTTTADFGFTPGTPYPTSGKMTGVIKSTTVGSTQTSTVTQVTTYDGTAIATAVMTFPNGSTKTCKYDMTKANVLATCTTP